MRGELQTLMGRVMTGSFRNLMGRVESTRTEPTRPYRYPTYLTLPYPTLPAVFCLTRQWLGETRGWSNASTALRYRQRKSNEKIGDGFRLSPEKKLGVSIVFGGSPAGSDGN